MQLVVTGFHRSRTSLVTALLHRAGLFVGDDLLGAMPSNLYGHFEDREVLELHREILADHGDGWQVDRPTTLAVSPEQWRRMRELVQARTARHRYWGFKEPRVCLLLGAWHYLMPDAKFLIVYRDPAECVRSLQARQGLDYLRRQGPVEQHRRFFSEPDHGLRVWDTYNRAVVAFARAHLESCLVLPSEALSEGFPLVARVNERFGSDLDEVSTSAVFDARVTGTDTRELPVHDEQVAARVARTWNDLEELAMATRTR